MHSSDMQPYIAHSTYIDCDESGVCAKARELAAASTGELDLVERCFEFVRDRIRHSWDYQLNPVTCRASDVLRHGTGYCYAKSHLLAALLRACGVPAGLCYQRLSVGDAGPPYCLHGLNAVHLRAYGWYRLDARGNKAGVTARFCPPREVLAFPIRGPEECDLPGILAEPLPAVVAALEKYRDVHLVHANLPDVAPAAWRAVAGDPHSISR
jgi:transglutaminase-like putative cysteine protease